MLRSGAVICGSVLLLAGCTVSYRAPDSLLEAVEDGGISPCHIVFVFGGIYYDLGRHWNHDLQDELAEAGRLGISVTYYCDLFGVWFNYGTTEPGRLTADMMEHISEIHQAGNCQTPLVFDAVGFSAGCEVILAAARELSNRDRAPEARFRRVLFIHSSSFAWSGEIGTYIDEQIIDGATNYFSPIDIVTIFAPLGAGTFGMHSGGDRVHNEMTWMFHSAHLISEDLRDRMRESLFGETYDTPAPVQPTDFGRALAGYLRDSPHRDKPGSPGRGEG